MNRRKFIAGAGGLIAGSALGGCLLQKETRARNWRVHDGGEFSDYHDHDHVYVDVECTATGAHYLDYSMKIYSSDGFFITETGTNYQEKVVGRERLLRRTNTDVPSDCHVSLVIHNAKDFDEIELNAP